MSILIVMADAARAGAVGLPRRPARPAAALALVVAAACGSSADVVDAATADAAPSTVPVVVSVFYPDDPANERPDVLSLFLDGVSGERNGLGQIEWQKVFPSYEAAVAEGLVVEARFGDVLVDQIAVGDCGTCVEEARGNEIVSERTTLCAFDTGELRQASVDCRSRDPAGHVEECVADSFCWPRCSPLLGCRDGSRCGRIVTYADPELAHLACVPTGTVPLAAACAVGSPGLTTGFDDCAAGAVCLQGICHAFCGDENDCAPDEMCATVPWEPSGFGVCQPDAGSAS